MKKVAITGLAAAAVLAGVAGTAPAMAQPYGDYDNGRNPCQQKQHNAGTTGAVVGGIAGALIGNGLASGGGRTGGTIIGGVAGAALGNQIGRGSARSSDTCDFQDRREARTPYYNGYNSGYYNGGYDGRYGYNGYNYGGYNGYYQRPYGR